MDTWDNEGGAQHQDVHEDLTPCPHCGKMVRELYDDGCLFCWYVRTVREQNASIDRKSD